MQPEDTGEETKLHEDCKMEVDSEEDSRKKQDRRKRERNIKEITDLDEELVESQKEILQQELLQIEQRRKDLLPAEHEKMQKQSQSLQDNKLQCQKMRSSGQKTKEQIRADIDKLQVDLADSAKHIVAETHQEATLEEGIGTLQAGGGRRGSDASQGNECCMDPAFLQQFVSMGGGAGNAANGNPPMRKSTGCMECSISRHQSHGCMCLKGQSGKEQSHEEGAGGDWYEEQRNQPTVNMDRQCQGVATKGFQRMVQRRRGEERQAVNGERR